MAATMTGTTVQLKSDERRRGRLKRGLVVPSAVLAAWLIIGVVRSQAVARDYEDGIRAHPQDWHMLQKVFVADLDPERLAAADRAALGEGEPASVAPGAPGPGAGPGTGTDPGPGTRTSTSTGTSSRAATGTGTSTGGGP